jgi:hypothetical protein
MIAGSSQRASLYLGDVQHNGNARRKAGHVHSDAVSDRSLSGAVEEL